MYTIKRISLSEVRIFNKMGLSEHLAPNTVSEGMETLKDMSIINTFRDLFKNPDFVTGVHAKIATLPEQNQSRLNQALNNVLAINNTIESIHENVRGQLITLLDTVEHQTA